MCTPFFLRFICVCCCWRWWLDCGHTHYWPILSTNRQTDKPQSSTMNATTQRPDGGVAYGRGERRDYILLTRLDSTTLSSSTRLDTYWMQHLFWIPWLDNNAVVVVVVVPLHDSHIIAIGCLVACTLPNIRRISYPCHDRCNNHTIWLDKGPVVNWNFRRFECSFPIIEYEWLSCFWY